MGGRRLPRLVLLVLVATVVAALPGRAAGAAGEPLVVPSVAGQAYVFAKGTLEDAGFAWRVEGPVEGYAANVVVAQRPAAGAKVVAGGVPVVVLRLSRSRTYRQEGEPQNASPYPGTPVRIVGAPARPRVASTVAAKAKQRTARTQPRSVPLRPEPEGELPLPRRARELAAWLERHPRPTSANVHHWLYQHNWVVTGARFGWSGGAEALRVLIRVDERAQRLWGVGARSERVARTALAEVVARA